MRHTHRHSYDAVMNPISIPMTRHFGYDGPLRRGDGHIELARGLAGTAHGDGDGGRADMRCRRWSLHRIDGA